MKPDPRVRFMTTWNFMLAGSDGGTYTLVDGFALDPENASSGAHVSEARRAEKTWPPGKGQPLYDGARRIVGHVVWYLKTNGDDVGYGKIQEFALVRLKPGQRWFQTVCGFGMPRGIDVALDTVPVPVQISIYGQGELRDTRDQQDYLPYGRNSANVVQKVQPVDTADTSAPVLSGDNQALGFLDYAVCCGSAYGSDDVIARQSPDPPGTGGQVHRLAPVLRLAEHGTHLKLQLERHPTGLAR